MSISGERFMCSADLILVFLIRGHINDFVCDSTVFLVDLAIRCLNETVLVNSGIAGQRADQTDVRTFRSLNRADTGIMAVVHVTDFERSTVTVQTARTQSAQTTLMRQLSKRIGLVHKL